MKKIITFFLASSITDIEYDRLAVGDFINQINNIYQSMDIYIRLYKCEDECMNHSICIGGTQKSLDDLIRESDLCFVLFWHKAGSATEHELQVAFESFQKHNKPKIVVYFKTLSEGETLADDVKRIMKIIDDEMLHYHREYSHIDSLKLGIITQLAIHGFIRSDLTVEGDAIKANGQKIASVGRIPLFSENDEYLELAERYREIEKQCDALLHQYSEDKSNAKVFRAYQKAIKERQRISEDISEMTAGILNIGERIASIASSSAPSERIRKAIKCFDIGDYQGVLDILHPDEIESQIRLLDAMEEQIIMARNNIIEEYRLRILALEAQGKWREIHETYELAAEQVLSRQEMPKTILLEYVSFLYKQRSYKKGIELCEKLRALFLSQPDGVTKDEQSRLAEHLGAMYYHCMQYAEAEKSLREALSLCEPAATDEQRLRAADIKVRLAKVLFKVNRHFESEALYSEALRIYRFFDEDGIQPIDSRIANACVELGDLYYMINRHQESGELFMDAYRKYSELISFGENKYRAAMANACDKAARLYIAVFSHLTSDRYYIEAMKVKQYLTKGEPSGYYAYLKRICEKLGNRWIAYGNSAFGTELIREAELIGRELEHHAYDGMEREAPQSVDYAFYTRPIDKAQMEELCKKSLGVYQVLAEENPEAYEPFLAQSYNTLGILYSHTGEKAQAEECFRHAAEIRELLAARSPLTMRTELAATYSCMAYHFYLWDDPEESEEYSKKAIQTYESVTHKEAGAFDTDLARNCNAIAKLYVKTGKRELAETFFFESVSLYIKLFKKSPRAYVDRIINTAANIFAFLDNGDPYAQMQEFLEPTSLK